MSTSDLPSSPGTPSSPCGPLGPGSPSDPLSPGAPGKPIHAQEHAYTIKFSIEFENGLQTKTGNFVSMDQHCWMTEIRVDY